MDKIYPTNFKSFLKWVFTNKTREKIYKDLGMPQPFDVTLRDGLQSLSKCHQKCYSLDKKKEMYNKIYSTYYPANIEIGSIVSSNVLPVFSDTIDLFNEVNDYNIKNYILIPNKKKLLEVVNIPNLINFSFITSASNSFQLKNTKLSLNDSYKELISMIEVLENNKINTNIKLYISCINECPIEGKLDNDIIVNEILKLNKLNINNICLSDTCGTLHVDDFEYIVDTCNYFGIPFSKFSLHLHVNPNKIDETKYIMYRAFDRKINSFDVSLLDTGGCSVTINKKNILPNLSYDLFYKFIVDYIELKS
jgi:hypothetical protein